MPEHKSFEGFYVEKDRLRWRFAFGEGELTFEECATKGPEAVLLWACFFRIDAIGRLLEQATANATSTPDRKTVAREARQLIDDLLPTLGERFGMPTGKAEKG